VHYQTGKALIDALQTERFDLLLLDWNLPDMSGYEVLNWVRANIGDQVIVLFLSNRALEENIVLGLMAGGDDYMIKPLRRAELLAKIHALSRRLGPQAPFPFVEPVASRAVFTIGVSLNLILKTVTVGNIAIELNPKEFDIAAILLQKHGQFVSRQQLMTQVWGHELMMTSRTLDTHMSKVRTKLQFNAVNGVHITTVYNSGYRLDVLA
jgi:DNA-binding response OmpR family regulator